MRSDCINFMQKNFDISQQVEYYLSDYNLAKDAFFYTKISEDAGGYLDLELVMNCNKIKTQGTTKEQILEAVKGSKLVEMNESGDRIRRKDNNALPEPNFKQKKLKTQDGAGTEDLT